MSLATLLVLADGRLPAGGHAHSGGLEAAVSTGRVRDLAGLDCFLRGRLGSAGLVAAAFAAVACARTADWAVWDAGLDARTPSPALRRASRAQGRALLRAGRAMWPVPSVGRQPHHPVALGAVAAAAGLGPAEAAVAAAHGTVTGPASAAVRLLGLDPYAVHALLAALAPECDRIAGDAASQVADATPRSGDPASRSGDAASQARETASPTSDTASWAAGVVDDLPAAGAPLLDVGAEQHAGWEVRLFAS